MCGKRSAQSILEYSILIALIIAGLVVMQAFMKRGYQGRLKSSADGLSGGDMYSVSNSTSLESQRMLNDRRIIEEAATGEKNGSVAKMAQLFNGPDVRGTTDSVYSVSLSTGGDMRQQTQMRMDNSIGEVTDVRAYQASGAVGNFAEGDFTSPVTDTLSN